MNTPGNPTQNMMAFIEEARVRLGITKGANAIIRVPPLAAVLGAGLTSAPQPVKFRRKCVVLGMVGQVADALDATAATTEVRLSFGTGREFGTDGTNFQFIPFLAAFGRQITPYGLELFGNPNFDWQVFYKNTGAGTVMPDLIFGVVEL